MPSVLRKASYSGANLTGRLCGAGSVLIGLGVSVGWMVHSTLLVQIAARFAPTQPNTAAALVLAGLGLIAIVDNSRRLMLACSAALGTLAVFSVIRFPGLPRMTPTAAVCFMVLAAALAISHTRRRRLKLLVLGIGGCVIAAAGLASLVGSLSGTSDLLAWYDSHQGSLQTPVGLFLLGAGAAALAWDMSQKVRSRLAWVPVGAALFVALVRLGLWEAYLARTHAKADFLSAFTLMSGLWSGALMGVVMHLALKAYLQRDELRTLNRRLEEEILERRLAQEAAQSASRAKSEFLANMSHEIRTPMTGVLGMIDLLLATNLSARQAEYLELAKSSADSLLSLLNDILDFSKIEAGRLNLVPVPFSIRQCVKDALRLFDVPMHQKRLESSMEIEAGVPDVVVGDPLRLRQVLVNLVGNAVKFTDTGRVSVRVSLESQTGSDIIVLTQVTDTGIGIPADKQELVFDPFRQADGSATRQHCGTGLGLSISSQLVRLMGGSMRLVSEPGKGSTFAFTACLGRAPVEAADQLGQDLRRMNDQLNPSGFAKRSLRVLLAEDNIVNQKLVGELLKMDGNKIVIVGNGRDAVAAVKEKSFDLVLMDIQMPLMDGYEATAAIRQAEKDTVRHTPIVAMTAHALKGDDAKCIQAGMDDYLSKPIDFGSLRAVLEKWGGELVAPVER